MSENVHEASDNQRTNIESVLPIHRQTEIYGILSDFLPKVEDDVKALAYDYSISPRLIQQLYADVAQVVLRYQQAADKNEYETH